VLLRQGSNSMMNSYAYSQGNFRVKLGDIGGHIGGMSMKEMCGK
jgi:hypothetical protein